MRLMQKQNRNIFIVGQVATKNAMENDFTVYDLKRIYSCSAPTARKRLNELVTLGLLCKTESPRGNIIRFTYHVTKQGHEFFLEYRRDYIAHLTTLWKQLMSYNLKCNRNEE